MTGPYPPPPPGEPVRWRSSQLAAVFRLQLELLTRRQQLKISHEDERYVQATIPFDAHYVTIQITISPTYDFEAEQK
jgi:hypothetical protein